MDNKMSRRMKAKSKLPGLLEEGEILVEYGDMPGKFYHETNKNPNGAGLDESSIIAYGGIDKYFEILPAIEFSKTVWFDMQKTRWRFAKARLQEEIDSHKSKIEALSQDIIKYDTYYGE